MFFAIRDAVTMAPLMLSGQEIDALLHGVDGGDVRP